MSIGFLNIFQFFEKFFKKLLTGLFFYAIILKQCDATMAQSAEHILGKDEVPGPNPGISSIKSPSDIDAEGDFFVILLGFT